MPGRTIAVLGATPKEDRYANMAMKLLAEHGELPVPVNPAFTEVLGRVCYPNVTVIPEPIHTITLYLGEARSTPLIPEILAAKPQRIIFNPGAENEELAKQAEAQGVEVVEDCTLVMLKTGVF